MEDKIKTIFDNIKKFIKSKFKFFDRKKALNPGNVEKNNTKYGSYNAIDYKKVNNRREFLKSIEVKNYIPEKGTVDHAILQYVHSLYYSFQHEKIINPYHSLIALGSISNTEEENRIDKLNEKNFIKNVESKKYSKKQYLNIQKNEKTGKPSFYHIISRKQNTPINSRLYLNCRKENIALLADKFASKLKDNEYYFKFNASDSNSTRSEQFVFYLQNDKEFNNIVNTIQEIKKESPSLFENSKNVNPFLKNIDGYICYAPDAHSGKYVDLKGNEKEIKKSFNTLLSNSLDDCTVSAINEMCKKHYDLEKIQNNTNLDKTTKSYLINHTYEKILNNPEYAKEFVRLTKNNLKISAMNNPELDILGIPNREEQIRKIERDKENQTEEIK